MVIRPIPTRLTNFLNPLSAVPKSVGPSSKIPAQIRHVSQNPERVIFSGIQPTGVPHLGNYLGALQQWVQLQKEPPSNTRLFYCVVDLHAITGTQNTKQLRKWRRETLAALLAVGLDPNRCTLFFQSSVPAHCELMWILSCTASVGYLSRMTQWKSKLALPDNSSTQDAVAKAKLKLGLFSYPVLQAADILLYGTTHVPVGEDQVQHLEFARECAGNFNALYGDILKRPETILSPAKRIMSLKQPTAKMSKSHDDPRSRILVSDSSAEISNKVRLALTDSTSGISYDPATRPGVSNLLSIMSYLDKDGRSCSDLAESYRDLTMRQFKEEVSRSMDSSLAGIRDTYNSFMVDERDDTLDNIAQKGAAEANSWADFTMARVKEAIGLY